MLMALPRVAAVVSCSLVLAGAAPAQTVAWGSVQAATGPADVSLNGAGVVALNLHGGSTQIDATVNGVTFVGGYSPAGWGGVNGLMNGSTTGDLEYDTLLNRCRNMTSGATGNPSLWGGIRLDTLATLQPGGLYEVQVWFADQRVGPNTQLYDRVMTLNSAWGTATLNGGEVSNLASMTLLGTPSGGLDADPDNAPAINQNDTEFGSFVTGVFTYVPGAQTWLVAQGSHPNTSLLLRPHLNAIQIRDISPASFVTNGSGCPSSVGVAGLVATSLPVVGGTLQVDMSNVSPTGLPLLIGGATAVAPYPIYLAGLTTDPSCVLLTSLDAVVGPLPVVGSTATFTLPVPANGQLVGFELFLQGAQYEASGVSLTEQGVATVGL